MKSSAGEIYETFLHIQFLLKSVRLMYNLHTFPGTREIIIGEETQKRDMDENEIQWKLSNSDIIHSEFAIFPAAIFSALYDLNDYIGYISDREMPRVTLAWNAEGVDSFNIFSAAPYNLDFH
jgi:hypothetical protein